MSNWLNRFVNKYVTKDDAVDFRSLKTTLLNKLESCGYVDSQIQPLAGHSFHAHQCLMAECGGKIGTAINLPRSVHQRHGITERNPPFH